MTLTQKKPKIEIPVDEINRRMTLFDEIIIGHPRMNTIAKRTMLLKRETESRIVQNNARKEKVRGRPIKALELWVLPIIGPTGSTKSYSMWKVVEEINSDPAVPDGEIPVLMVTLRNVRSVKDFHLAILELYDDGATDELDQNPVHNPVLANAAIAKIARRKKTSLIVIDEAHNILAYDAGKRGKQMAIALKSLVNEGVFSIILMGTERTKDLFKYDPELHSRCVVDGGVMLDAFDVSKENDRIYFFKFVKRLEERMLADGIIDEPIGLTSSAEDRAKVFDLAGGVVGMVGKFLRSALRVALDSGRTTIVWSDIQNVFQAWNAMSSEKAFDPFDNGPQKKTLAYVTVPDKKKATT